MVWIVLKLINKIYIVYRQWIMGFIIEDALEKKNHVLLVLPKKKRT